MPDVLLVEDSPTQARFVTGALEGTEFHTECVDRLQDALALLTQRDFSAVVLDLALPDSDGLHTYLRVQEAVPNTPVVVLTSTDDEELAMQVLRGGAQDYLIKGEVTRDWIVRSLRYSIQRFAASQLRRGHRAEYDSQRELRLDIESELPDVTIVRFRERRLLGTEIMEQIRASLFRLVDEHGKRKFLLDCGEVEYVSNSILGQLLVWDRRVRQHGGSVRIFNLQGSVQDQIRVRRLLAQFDICLDQETALRGL